MLNNEFPDKDTYVVPEQAPLSILYSKSAVCIDKNRKDIQNNIQISRIMLCVINGTECNLHETMQCEGGLQLADIGIMNVRGDEFNPRLGYDMVRLEK